MCVSARRDLLHPLSEALLKAANSQWEAISSWAKKVDSGLAPLAQGVVQGFVGKPDRTKTDKLIARVDATILPLSQKLEYVAHHSVIRAFPMSM